MVALVALFNLAYTWHYPIPFLNARAISAREVGNFATKLVAMANWQRPLTGPDQENSRKCLPFGEKIMKISPVDTEIALLVVKKNEEEITEGKIYSPVASLPSGLKKFQWLQQQQQQCHVIKHNILLHIDGCIQFTLSLFITVFSARCNIYISRLSYDASVRPSVCPSVCEVCALWSQGAMDPGIFARLDRWMSLLLTDNASPGSSDGMMPGFLVEEGGMEKLVIVLTESLASCEIFVIVYI